VGVEAAKNGARGYTDEELREAIDRAQEGDKSALPVIRKHLADQPAIYWEMAEYARIVQGEQIKAYTGGGLYVREIMDEVVRRLREDLSGGDPSPLERLLVERIISCYLHVNYAESEYSGTVGRGARLEVAEYMQKRLDRANKRYLQALKALAQVRKMGPAVQINIADRQLNVARPAPFVPDRGEGWPG